MKQFKTKNSKLLLLVSSALVVLLIALYYQNLSRVSYLIKYIPQLQRSEAKILVVWHGGFGEAEAVERLKIAAKNINIDLRVIQDNGSLQHSLKINNPVEVAIKIFKPDFVLSLEENLPYYEGAPNYMVLSHGIEDYIKYNETDGPEFINSHFVQFDALLPSFSNIELLKTVYEKSGKKYFGMPWYYSVYKTDRMTAIPHKLYYSGGSLWDKTRSSDKYIDVYKKLDQSGYFVVSGPVHIWQHLSQSAIGLLPFDGVAVIDAIHDAGIELILHDKSHFDAAAPTSRIFEAAAANVVIISDKHSFIINNFGDNVLYIDVEQDAITIFNQINSHMQWIMSHPSESQQMAANCNAIFKDKFSLEQQFLNLIAMSFDARHII